MRWLKITLAYDGAEFCGWQTQPGQRTVQGVFEDAWREITGERLAVSASGRTDAGVHAIGQVVGLASDTLLTEQALVRALNATLPEDVVVRSVEPAAENFHATRDAITKRYRYTLYSGRRPPLAWRRYAWHVPHPLDVEAMHTAGQRLLGTHDFAAFQNVGSPRQSTVRTLHEVSVLAGAAGQGGSSQAGGVPITPAGLLEWEAPALVAIDLVGDGFLYNMVRAIAGTLVQVGRGKRTAEQLDATLKRCERSGAGQTAPPHGLTLIEVTYPAQPVA
jgi:tRNA pseudouridine38-40 synthase